MAAVLSVSPSRWLVSHVSLVIDDYGVFGVGFGIRVMRYEDNDWRLVYTTRL